MQLLMSGIIGSPIGLSDLEYLTHRRTSPLAFGHFHLEEDRDLSSTNSLRFASFRS